MQIWSADFAFEIVSPPKQETKSYVTVKDVVAIRIPVDHIHKKTDIIARALRDVSNTIKGSLVKDKTGKYKVIVTYKRYLGQTNQNE